MAIGGVVINFAAKTRDAVSDVDKLARSVTGVDTAAGKAAGGTKKLSGMLKAGLAAGALAAGAAVVQLGQFMWDAGQAALEDQKSVEKLAGILRTIPGVTDAAITANEDWISSMQLATQVSDTDLRNAVGKLALATGDLGEAQRLAAAAADLAAVSGKSYSTVADAMTKAAMGNEEALKRVAPWLDVNRDGSISLSEALGLLEGKYGDAAEAAAEQDPWQTLKIIWDELKESLGQWLLPLIKKFGDWFKDPANRTNIQRIIDKVSALATQLGQKLVPMIEDFLDWMSSDQGKQDMRNFAHTVQTIADAFIATAQAIEKMIGWYQKIPSSLKSSSGFRLGSPIFGAGGIFDRAAPPPPATGATTRAAPTTVTINMQGAFNDPWANARTIKRLLEGEDARQGRDRGQPLAVAW